MQRVKSRSAIAINRHLGASTQVWQRGFHDRAFRRDEDVQQIARYVVANPLRKGLVSKLSDYPLWYAMWV
jgi:REP element-mobilizing transposase RayT